MGQVPGSRNRVLGDRLWDDDGQEWTTRRADWVTAKQVRQLIGRDQRVLVHSYGRSVQWLGAAAAPQRWSHVRHHFEVPGEHGAEPDDEGRTWGAHLWRRGDARLLGFETFC